MICYFHEKDRRWLLFGIKEAPPRTKVTLQDSIISKQAADGTTS